MVAAALAVLAGLLWLLTSDRTSPLSGAPTDQIILEVIRLAFYAVAGIGGVIALTVAYRKQRLNEAEAEGERAKLFNERFAAAADQLASERAANRLAGVYAMAALADEWDAGRQTCVNVLCAYMRMPYESPPPRAEREATGMEEFRTVLEERLVRKTVLAVITERLRLKPIPGRTWHECAFDFTGATIDEGNFDGTLFLGTASFEYTRFPRGSVGFVGAVFHGPVSFKRSHYSGGRVLFDAAEFDSEADFSELTVAAGFLNFNRTRFQHRRISFAASVFSGGKVRFDSCRFVNRANLVFDRGSFTGSDIAFFGLNPEAMEVSFGSITAWAHPPAFDKASAALAPDHHRVRRTGQPAASTE
jgi:hypothetical protein